MNAAPACAGSSAGNAMLAGWRRAAWRLAHLVVSMLAARHRRAVAYRDLLSLDAHMLRDLGLSHRAAAERCCDRTHDHSFDRSFDRFMR